MTASPSSSDRFPVVIIGGGLAGLTAALHLARRGIPPVVLEADARWPGGRLSGGAPETFEHAGRVWSFRPDHGVHALWGNYPNMRRVLTDMLGAELRLSTGEDWVDRWGREVRITEAGNFVRHSWLGAPFHYLMLILNPRFWPTITPLDFLSAPGYLVSTLLALSVDPIREQRRFPGLTLDDFFIGWTRNLRVTFVGLARNLLAAPAEAISLSAFIACLRFYTLLRRDAWTLHYLPGNAHDHIVQPAIDRVEAGGGAFMLGAEALELTPIDGGWRVRVEDKRRGGMRSLLADHVILATEPPAAARLFAASPALAQRAAALDIPAALPNIAVRLWFDRTPRTNAPGGMFTGDFPMDNFFWLQRLYDDFREWREVTGGAVLEVHLYGKDDIFSLSNEALLARVTGEVGLAFPALRGAFVHGAVRRNLATQTVFEVPTDASLPVETPWPALYACGDWIAHPTPALNMERSTITAIAAANRVLTANGSQPYNLLPMPRPEIMARALGALLKAARWLVGPPIMALARLVRRKE